MEGIQTKKQKYHHIRDVVKFLYKEKIDSIISIKTTENAGHKDWLKHHPAAVTQCIEEMTEEDRKEAQLQLEEWKNQGISEEIQRK